MKSMVETIGKAVDTVLLIGQWKAAQQVAAFIGQSIMICIASKENVGCTSDHDSIAPRVNADREGKFI